MHISYHSAYSRYLNREMEFKVYGHSGLVFFVFPAQDGRFFDFENFKMVDACASFIERGLIQLCCLDSIDRESWSLLGEDEARRIEMHEAYFAYVNEELYPMMRQIHLSTSGSDNFEAYTTGCSMGATHALNFFLRRPDLYKGVLALSGVYHASYFFPNYHDSRIYDNSITDYLPNMPYDHYYLDKYRCSKIVICVGQGRWEKEAIEDTLLIKDTLERLKVPAWIDFWGYDVDHDWPWWQKQLPYFLGYFI